MQLHERVVGQNCLETLGLCETTFLNIRDLQLLHYIHDAHAESV